MNPHALLDDPLLTAFALSELNAETDGALITEIAAAVDADPRLLALVEEIRETAALLEGELSLEATPTLTDDQRDAIFAAAPAPANAPRPAPMARTARRPRRAWPKILALATAGVSAVAMLGIVAVGMKESAVATDVGALSHGDEVTTLELQTQEVQKRILPGNVRSASADRPVQEVRARGGRPDSDNMDVISDPNLPSTSIDVPTAGGSGFDSVDQRPVTTFSVDVDTASYSYIRRALERSQWPHPNAVRIEEMINYFDYDLPPPTGPHPLAIHVDVTDAPWNANHLIARVALKAREIAGEDRAEANLVFLIDVSGSMQSRRRLPLVKKSLRRLVEKLQPNDTVSLVVYSGRSGVVLDATKVRDKQRILRALAGLEAGGSTNGGSGIRLAYKTARRAFKKGGINRVIVATDGDFNVGATSRAALEKLVAEEAKSNVFLTVLGFGMDNLNDANLETLADRGNGHYAYIDDLAEANKVLVKEISSTLVTVAKDVKVQLEMNPARVAGYRLVGYDNRKLANRAFSDDKEDAGDMGAGHAVTMLYELVPPTKAQDEPPKLRYQRELSEAASSGELFSVKVRYKTAEGAQSKLIERFVHESSGHFEGGSEDLRFATAVAAFGLLLKRGPDAKRLRFDDVADWAENALGDDPDGRRAEMVRLIRRAQSARAPVRGPTRSNRLDDRSVRQVITANKSSVSACFQQARKSGASEAPGKYEFRLVVEPSGAVARVGLDQRRDETPLVRCIVGELEQWQFPAFEGTEETIVVPFLLQGVR